MGALLRLTSKRNPFGALVILACIVAVGCGDLSPEIRKEISDSGTDFLLGPEDVLEVTVWRNQDLSKQVIVRPDGMVSMPLIGDIRASGRTAAQLSEEIAKRLREFKESPQVSVSVKEVNSYYIYVLGEFNKPGRLQFKSPTTVLQAIAMAGGYTLYAWRNRTQVVRVIRDSRGEQREIRIPVNYSDLVAGKGEVGNFILKTGDTLVVP